MSQDRYSILLIEDDRVDQLAFKRFVEQAQLNYDYEIVSSFREAKNILSNKQFDVVIADYFLGDGTAFDVFRYISNSAIIVTTGSGDEEIAVRAMKSGAYDYLIKDSDRNYLTVLPITVENALKQKRADEDQKKLKLLESAILNAFDAVLIVEITSPTLETTKVIYVNDSFCKIAGVSFDEVVGQSIKVMFERQFKPEIIDLIISAFEKKEPFSTETHYFQKNGDMIWVEFTMQYVRDDVSNSDFWVILQKDITERKRAEEQLRLNKERLDIILQSMGDGVIVVDAKQKVMIINNKAKELLGNIDKNGRDITLGDILENCKDHGKELLNALDRWSFNNLELHVQKPRTRVLLVTCSSFLDVDGENASKVLILRDFTHEKEIEQMKNDFVSNVSHELRTPLSSILGFSSTILKDNDMPPEVKNEFNEIIYKESTRLASLIEDMLSISRIESGKSLYVPKELELEPLVDDVHKSFKIQVEEKKIKLIKEIEKDLPPIFADPKAIRQVLVNLLGNAIKFTNSGGEVKTSIRTADGQVIIEVSDTGIGIPKKDINRIFDKFFRVYRKGNPMPGTGLGLSIVKEIVNFHKGKIEVESEENQGTTFRMYFPIYQEETKNEQQHSDQV